MNPLWPFVISLAVLFRILHIALLILREAGLFYLWRPFSKSYNLGRRLAASFERLGPTFIKFGQILSTRRDLFSDGDIAGLARLQSNVAPFPFRTAKRVIERSFKKPLNKIFSSFERAPVASASLGVVYRARIGKETVAVKVQRPHSRRILMIDTAVLMFGVRLAALLTPGLRRYHLDDAVLEFRRWTLNELNYTLEAANADIFSQRFEDDERIYSPKVYWDATTREVLTLEYIEGMPLKELIATKGESARKKRIAAIGADSFLRQYFEFGFFHADPHPSNIFVKKGDSIYFLDFGMVGRLDSRLMELLAHVLLGLLQKDEAAVVQNMLAVHREYADDPTIPTSNINAFRRHATEVVDQWFGVSNRKHNFTLIFYNLLQAATAYGLFVPVDVLLMAKSIVTLDSVTRQLDSDFDLGRLEEPLLKALIKKRLDPARVAAEAQNLLTVLTRMAGSLPAYSDRLSAELASGSLGSGAGPRELAALEARLEARATRRGLGTVIGALFLGSAVLLQSGADPVILGA
ncbi:MAG: AarF/ABC1/UbiB kinase family protein, partial [Parcubacteria group bacterium]|nr:AarF/ABC1/UbiB kinase family protein [Parcubacteria group bacterium]